MATSSTNAAAALGDMTRFAEMRQRLWFLLGALVVYRVGTFIPVPGIDAARFAAFFSTQQGTLLGIFNMFSGGALQRFSIFALNVMPYITASIIVQTVSYTHLHTHRSPGAPVPDEEARRCIGEPHPHRARRAPRQHHHLSLIHI